MIKRKPKSHHPIFDMLTVARSMGHSVMTTSLAKSIKRRRGYRYDPREVARYIADGSLVKFEPVLNRGLGMPAAITTAQEARYAASVAAWLAMATSSPALPLEGQEKAPVGLTRSQERAWKLASQPGSMCLTGWPGTGKTWLAAQMIKRAKKNGAHVEVCAPTGKAASVLSLKLDGVTVRTIHRQLGLRPGGKPSRNVSAEFLFVDESSMIDEALMAHLMAMVNPEKTKVVFVGDPNQLPPVGAGAPFSRMVRHSMLTTAQLNQVVRQEDGNGIVTLANGIVTGGRFVIPPTDVVHYYRKKSDVAAFAEELYLKEDDGTQRNVMILTPIKQKKFDGSTSSINERLSYQLYPQRLIPGCKFTSGDRIMFTVNDYTHGYVNGELGCLLDWKRKGRKAVVINDTGTEYKLEGWSIGSRAEWAYALTIHKAQGSECDTVILVITSDVPSMYTRELVYTAVTRAKKKLIIVGDLDILKRAIRRRESRVTALDYFIAGGPALIQKHAAKRAESLRKVFDYGP